MSSKRCNSQYTLQGTQPYVLTSNWPQGFTYNQTKYVPDLSLQNVTGYNYLNNYQPVNFQSKLLDKKNIINAGRIYYPYEKK